MSPRFENLVAKDYRVEAYAEQYAVTLQNYAYYTVKSLLEQYPELQAVKEAYNADRFLSYDMYEEFFSPVYNLDYADDCYNFDDESDKERFIMDFESMLKFDTIDTSILTKAIMDHYAHLYYRLYDVYQERIKNKEIKRNKVSFNVLFIDFMMTFTPIALGEIEDVGSRLGVLNDDIDNWFNTCMFNIGFEEFL